MTFTLNSDPAFWYQPDFSAIEARIAELERKLRNTRRLNEFPPDTWVIFENDQGAEMLGRVVGYTTYGYFELQLPYSEHYLVAPVSPRSVRREATPLERLGGQL